MLKERISMNRNTSQVFLKILFVAITVAALLAACGPTQAAQSPEQIQAQIATSVAQTVAAQQAAQPTSTETATPTPTEVPAQVVIPTLTPILPTATTFVLSGGGSSSSSGSSGGSSSGGGSSSSKSTQYSCALIGQVPNDGSPATILKVGDTLDVKWTFRNTGTKTWDPTWTWNYYSSQIDTSVATNYGLTMSYALFQTALGASVAPGDTITLGVELTAPSNFDGRDPIHIGTAFTIIGDGSKFCKADINVEVIRPGMTP